MITLYGDHVIKLDSGPCKGVGARGVGQGAWGKGWGKGGPRGGGIYILMKFSTKQLEH